MDSSKLSNILKAKEDMQKSAEQLEQEKREILAQRVPKLSLEGRLKDDLIQIARQFHEVLLQVYTNMYELSEKYERQKYDMMELAERARQIEKGKAKTRKSNIVHTGLGGSVFATLTETFPQAPQKISLFSRYERVTDRRTFKDRRDMWAIQKKEKEFVAERPKAKIKHIEVAPQEPEIVRRKPKKSESEDAHKEEAHHEEAAPAEEEHHEEAAAEDHHEEEAAPAEEEHHEEEAPAEEEHHEEAEEAADE